MSECLKSLDYIIIHCHYFPNLYAKDNLLIAMNGLNNYMTYWYEVMNTIPAKQKDTYTQELLRRKYAKKNYCMTKIQK